jgi:hypothetical protein
MRLLPFRRLSAAIPPIVGSPALASKPSLDLRGGIVGELFGEGHGQTIHGKNKSAMPKIILAIRRQCRQSTHMSNTATLAMTPAQIHATDKSSHVMTHPLGGFRVINTERMTMIDYNDDGSVVEYDSIGTKAKFHYLNVQALRSQWKLSLANHWQPLKS